MVGAALLGGFRPALLASAELPDGRVLALDGNRLSSDDAELLRAFLAQLRTRRERALLDALETTTPPPAGLGPESAAEPAFAPM